ncbi:MAG: NAD(P)-dependent oxidoreductase [Lentisphaerota bacterium]
MKILVVDKLSDAVNAQLEKLGGHVICKSVTAEELPQNLADIEILIVRSTKVTAEAIKSAPQLSLIIRAGAGVNTVDLAAASSRGIHVANCPGKNTAAVAELTIGLLIAADRRIVNAATDLRNGKWRKKEYSKAGGLKGRTLGIVGLGSIGKAVAGCAKGLGMNVIAWSRSLTPEAAEEMKIGYCASLTEVAEKADAVTVHLAYSAEMKHLIGGDFLSRLKNGAIFINTSRGEIADTAALKEAIKSQGLNVAADVLENEPAGGEAGFADTELAKMITGTPHIGASTGQAAEAIADEVVKRVESYKRTGRPLNTVNISAKSSAIINLVIRHYNRVGVLAGVLDKLRNDGINIEEMENLIFEGGHAASCTLRLDAEPAQETIKSIEQDANIIKVLLN